MDFGQHPTIHLLFVVALFNIIYLATGCESPRDVHMDPSQFQTQLESRITETRHKSQAVIEQTNLQLDQAQREVEAKQ